MVYNKATLKLFISFLKRYNVYSAYLTNLKKRHKRYAANNIVESIHWEGGYTLLSSAFCWANTYEGDLFWRNLNQKWTEEIRNNRYAKYNYLEKNI